MALIIQPQMLGTFIEPGNVCRAMPLPVIGSVSEPEAIGLGKLFQSQARKQTGTLFNGIDFAPEANGTCMGQFKAFFVHQTGKLCANSSLHSPEVQHK